VEVGAQLDETYHPGVWRSPMYTCCDSINKRTEGCKPTMISATATRKLRSNQVPVTSDTTATASKQKLDGNGEAATSLAVPPKQSTYV